MFKLFKGIPNRKLLNYLDGQKHQIFRTFLSQAYYCEEVWNQRLNNPILQKVKVEGLFIELDQKYQRTKQISALDVDLFANAVQDDSFHDELLDVIHKLRLTADTGNTLESTSHALVRILLQFGKKEDLLNVLDDRLNYGIFLDSYTANLCMDTFWKSKEFANGARIASQLMLQEELENPLSCCFGLLHCYNYLLNPQGWPEHQPAPEPEEEIKIRVKYLRNPYDDEHFDLRDPNQIVGKTLASISKNKDDPLHQSFYVLGMSLFGKNEVVQKACAKVNQPLYKEILDLVPADSEVKSTVDNLKSESVNVADLLTEKVQKTFQQTSEQDIVNQCKTFEKWEEIRAQVLQDQKRRLSTAKRLADIEDLKKVLKEKEEKLWFFDKEEQIDLAIEAKKVYYPKRWFGNKKKPRKVDEGYIPPEVQSKHIGGSQLN